MSTPQSSQCQRMYTLHFPLHCTVHITCSEMHLFTSVRKKVYAVAYIIRMFQASKSPYLMQQTTENTQIGTFSPKNIHPLINHFVCLCVFVNLYVRICIYTGCHRRNGPNFGRVFLMLNYTDITQITNIQS